MTLEQELMRISVEQDMEYVMLTCFKFNQPALSFYNQKLG